MIMLATEYSDASRSIRAPTRLTYAEWLLMAGPIAIPCDGGKCSYEAKNAKSEAENEVLQPWI
jgi:hypothetical protein